MFGKAVDSYPSALEWVPDWFVTPKTLKDLDIDDLDNTELEWIETA